MKITTIGGVLTAQAETVEDVKTLLALTKEQRIARPVRARKPRKHKTPCTICGKRYKGMKRHILLAHTQPQTPVETPSEFLV